MVDKRHILDEIKRLAIASGKPPGVAVFERETGIKQSDWYPHIWLRWKDALAEIGYAPNQLQTRISDEVVIQKYVSLVRELGRLPVIGEIRRKARNDKSFPSHTVFSRFGGKEHLIEAVARYCRDNPDLDNVLALCDERSHKSSQVAPGQKKNERKLRTGFVYLMKSGPHYKIGRTSSVGRRESELVIKIPIPPKTIHRIETDDPPGVEAYWHSRSAKSAVKENGSTCLLRTSWRLSAGSESCEAAQQNVAATNPRATVVQFDKVRSRGLRLNVEPLSRPENVAWILRTSRTSSRTIAGRIVDSWQRWHYGLYLSESRGPAA